MTTTELKPEARLAAMKMLRAGETTATAAAILGLPQRDLQNYIRATGGGLPITEDDIARERKFVYGHLFSFRTFEDNQLIRRARCITHSEVTDAKRDAQELADRLESARAALYGAWAKVPDSGVDLLAEVSVLNAATITRLLRARLAQVLAVVDAEQHAQVVDEAVRARMLAEQV